ncbi:Transcription initiation factor IIA large subunit [Pseudocercospora fuligena]|uniref:Transcription initiation factor IIA large subunit n=1 Tax=Pseudocercospora fuligena TaxID=685502 RepID=A0A8H6VLU7_9PEZI|nr:Transcription initiation factor IIA large subunit [Pseudocercospora fuligena]
MTNNLVGDVYAKIIEEVVAASSTDFEENGVVGTTLQELQQEWQAKLSARGVAAMPWDPKPQPAAQQAPASASIPSGNVNGLPVSSSYPSNPYAASATANDANGTRIKAEPGSEHQYHGLPNGNGYQQNGVAAPMNTQGGSARAQQLLQQQFGSAANPSVSAMQRGGLALPGQQAKPQGLQLPPGSPAAQQHFQQQQAQAMQQQQQRLQQQQTQPRIKVENDSPQLQQGSFNQQGQGTNYSQTDGADEDMDQWRAMLAERRALHAQQGQQADRMMRDHVMQLSEDLSNGLMVPLDQHPSKKNKKRRSAPRSTAVSSSAPSSAIPQLDGDADEDEEKPEIKDEDDENAINSDLDDSDDDGAGVMGDDEDELGDTILCTYDKVQRVKNKWKCTLKDGVMSVNGKEWVFHKGMGEFEW